MGLGNGPPPKGSSDSPWTQDDVNSFMDRDDENMAIQDEMDGFFSSFFGAAKYFILAILFIKICVIVGVFTLVYLILNHFGVIMAGVF